MVTEVRNTGLRFRLLQYCDRWCCLSNADLQLNDMSGLSLDCLECLVIIFIALLTVYCIFSSLKTLTAISKMLHYQYWGVTARLWFVQPHEWLSRFHQWNWFSEKQIPSGQQLVGCQSGKRTEQTCQTQLILSLVSICLVGAGDVSQWCWLSHFNGLHGLVCGLENTVCVSAHWLSKSSLLSTHTHTQTSQQI